MAFPKALYEKITAIIDQLNAFGAVEEFKYCISDFCPEEVTRPGFDDSNWISFKGIPPFTRDQGVTWVRVKYTVPEKCLDIPLTGSELRVTPGSSGAYFAPLQIYADGELLLSEVAWMDCKCPEGIISKNAEPGKSHTIAMRFDYGEKSFWEPRIGMAIASDAVEHRALHLTSILDELVYAEGFRGADEILPKAYALLEEAAVDGRTEKLMEAARECRRLCEPLRAEIKRSKVYVVTHAHIDMNWFWSIEETERIVNRDFTTMTTLMEENPDFKFSQSQCATYKMEERQNPEVFAKMREFVKKGQWDVTAANWVEGDLNMASGEAIARHALYSKKYLKDKFNVEPRIMWCPDTFGHPGSIPQILKKCGIDYYYHTRCGIGVKHAPQDNFDYIRDAHHVPLYWWRGQDGSRVLSCNTVYGREFSTDGVLRMSKAMRERFQYDKCMFVFGVGDHGGGPTRRDIAWMREISQFPTVPTLLFSTTKEFYDEVMRDNPAGLPEHKGEMNFVFDGCYTTHANIKYYNRRCESDLEATENLCAMASLFGFTYPAREFEELWQRTLFSQFHDIFDGAGIKDTYAFSIPEARQVLSRLDEISKEAMAVLAGKAAAVRDLGTPVLVYNPTFAKRDECFLLPVDGDYTAIDEHGAAMPSQKAEGGNLVFASLPPFGYRTIYLAEKMEEPFTAIQEADDYYHVSTRFYEIEIHKHSGRVTTLLDKRANRFVVRREQIGWRLKNGCLNTLEVHYEEPTPMSAWTIGSVKGVQSLISGAKSRIIEDGPVRKRIRFEHEFDSSTLCQDILIYPDSPRIDFETHVDWKEYGDFHRDAPMLKVSFSPDIQNAAAVYEIPYGVMERFPGDYECPALRFADISHENYGFAVLNDSKHGYKSCGNRMELTLIRSGWLPDQKSDFGEHCFTYSILPHEGDYIAGGVMAQAVFLNNLVRTAAGAYDGVSASAATAALFAPECPDIPVCGVKRSEDGEAIILKLYNTTDSDVKTSVRACFPIGDVKECDLIERPLPGAVAFGEGSFETSLGMREIKSFRVRPL